MYFTKEEVKEVRDALSNVSGAGINVDSYPTLDEQKQTFFDKAKLWRVIERIISSLYIERLAKGKMFLHDKDGIEYIVVERRAEGL
jgi:hypothetical protein